MKKVLIILICLSLIGLTIFFIKPISNYIANFISKSPELVIKPKNEYTKTTSYQFVRPTSDYIPYSYQDLLNIIYSVINNGWDSFTFYCPKEYSKCLEDIETISGNELILTHINNYVHPFNGFTNVNTTISESGEITINVNYLYEANKIEQINPKVDELIKELVTDDMSDYDKIKAIHDYIINNSKYDVERTEKGESIYDSYSAFGPLFQGYATCNGYTDLMAVFLSKMGIDNYKVATTPERISYQSEGHIWNAVYVDDEWLHMDLTWDDPVSKSGEDFLFHTYFLVDNEAMAEADKGEVVVEEHNFDKLYYLEFNY